ncbi:inactive disease resistance protein RPS4-like [Nymphaea colorata]|uniref:inactive disease resistance protein RPS4-like n=1 Tax=Nymphaea colorata TaxID=210225 RepID=UPI00129E188C|nr:inactive disease resistance protein RPS4-like [Nymphaea colorata]
MRGFPELLSWMKETNSKLDESMQGSEAGEPLPPLPSKVFGIEKPLIELKGMLRRHQVVGVCGMGGSGKTTLVFGGRALQEPRYPSSPDLRTIWQRLFKKLNKINDGAFATEAPASGRRGKMLIVLDVVSSVDKDIRTLVDETNNAADSRILITLWTKLDNICDSTYLVNSLSEDDGRKLFEHHALLRDRERSWKPDKQLIDSERLQASPLALQVIGNSLAKRDKREWQDIANRLKLTCGSFQDRSGDEIIESLSSSLKSLTEEERKCFLDTGCFPEGQTIPASAIMFFHILNPFKQWG